MLGIEEIRNHLQYMVLARVAQKTGVSRGTLIRINAGLSSRPSHSVIVALSEFLMGLRDNDK